MDSYHISVLLQEAIEYLQVEAGSVFVDTTLGGGGYTQEILKRGGRVIALDQDPDAIKYVKKKLGDEPNLRVLHGNFSEIKYLLQQEGIVGVSGVVFDLGLSSHQIEKSGRGFSFLRDEPLDMRMDPEIPINAEHIVNTFSASELSYLFARYGEEHNAEKIAYAIVRARKIKNIKTTKQLVDVIGQIYKTRGKIHPATKVFQALRIIVNNEIDHLKQALEDSFDITKSSGRVVVVSFHSLEDRIVKQQFRKLEFEKRGKIIQTVRLTAGKEEKEKNRRSRSAKLRVIEKL